MRKPLLIVIAGPNGSGKTTITRSVIRHEWAETCEYINPDEVAQHVFGDWNDKEAVRKAVNYCDELRERLLCEHKDMIFETVLSSEGKVDFIRRAKDAGYFVRVFFICTATPEINASRVANRVMKGGHDVPITKIISRYERAISNMAVITPLIDRAYFYDNSVDNRDACPLFRTTDGLLAKQYTETIPDWTISIYNKVKQSV